MKFTSPARASFSALCLLLLAVAPLRGQEAVPASLRFVNATGLEAPLTIRIHGEPLQARGYRSGEATGPLELAAGPCHMELTQPLLGSITLTLALPAGEARTVVALSQSNPEKADRPRSSRLACHVLAALPPGPPTQRRLQLLQVTPLPELDVRLEGRNLRCTRLRTETLALAQPNPLVEHAGSTLCRLPFEEAGDGTLIFFAGTDGRLRQVFFLVPVRDAELLDRE